MPEIPLTINDVLFSIGGAAILFVLYKAIAAAIRIYINKAFEQNFNPDQIQNVLENCYRTFPIDSLSFNGAIFTRGTPVRIKTSRKTTIEGQFIGVNQSELVCLITEKSVIAQEIKAILEIQPM